MGALKIRASMLPDYSDCMRRTIGRIVRPNPSRVRRVQVATLFGTVVHTTLANYIAEGGLDVKAEVSRQMSIETDNAKHLIEYDSITPSQQVWFAQAYCVIQRLRDSGLDRMIKNGVVFCEQEFSMPLGKLVEGLPMDILVGGTVDILTAKGTVVDWKTGMHLAVYPVQMALYGMMAEANGAEVKALMHYWIRRKDAQLKSCVYDYEDSKRMTIATLSSMVRNLRRGNTDNVLQEVRPNPSSRLCSEKYCDLYGTRDCRFGLMTTHHPEQL